MSNSLGARLYRGEVSLNFIGNAKRWYALSGVLILISLGALLIQGLHLGIEFKGGASFAVKASTVSISGAREALSDAGISGDSIVQ